MTTKAPQISAVRASTFNPARPTVSSWRPADPALRLAALCEEAAVLPLLLRWISAELKRYAAMHTVQVINILIMDDHGWSWIDVDGHG